MKVISSPTTKFYKYGFPAIWFGFLGVFVVTGIASGVPRQAPMFLIAPCVMAVFGFVLFKRMVWVLVDEVKLVPGSRNTRRPAVGTTLAGGPLEKVAGKRAVTASNYCL